jgi:hypothetical protein
LNQQPPRNRVSLGLLVLAVLMTVTLLTCAASCAVAPRGDGAYVVGVPLGNEPGSPADIGTAVGGVLGLFGVPGAEAVALAVTAGLGIFGAKRHADARAEHTRREAERSGWDEAAATYSPHPPGPRQPPTAQTALM